MSAKSKIEWTDATWNPVTGCTKISEGCRNCYAERIANRFWDHPFTEVQLRASFLDKVFDQPYHWKKPRRIFVCSMGDLFHEDVPTSFIGDVVDVMGSTSQHTYMILTKRPQRMMELWNINSAPGGRLGKNGLKNVWLGVSVENQKAADERIPLLLQTPAPVRFVSVEPMLEEINLTKPFCKTCENGQRGFGSLSGFSPCPECDDNPGLHSLDWVICGAESGPGARPFEMGWARDLKNQCVQAGVPFFFKQGRIEGKLVKMPELDGQVWDQYPEVK